MSIQVVQVVQARLELAVTHFQDHMNLPRRNLGWEKESVVGQSLLIFPWRLQLVETEDQGSQSGSRTGWRSRFQVVGVTQRQQRDTDPDKETQVYITCHPSPRPFYKLLFCLSFVLLKYITCYWTSQVFLETYLLPLVSVPFPQAFSNVERTKVSLYWPRSVRLSFLPTNVAIRQIRCWHA